MAQIERARVFWLLSFIGAILAMASPFFDYIGLIPWIPLGIGFGMLIIFGILFSFED